MVAYDGGGPAAIATAAGEAMVTTQLAVEQTELVRGGRLRPLAVMSASRWSSRASIRSRR